MLGRTSVMMHEGRDMSPEAQKILGGFQERGLRSGSHIHPADFGEAIVWQGGFIRDEPVRLAVVELLENGYLIEYAAAFELTELGDRYLYGRDETTVEVDGYPPAKSEALSILGAGHSHSGRVKRLLEAVKAALEAQRARDLGSVPLVIHVELRCPRDGTRSDATNYLGGITDVLQDKTPRGTLPQLGDLATVHLFDDDRQVEEIHFRCRQADRPSYSIRLAPLDG